MRQSTWWAIVTVLFSLFLVDHRAWAAESAVVRTGHGRAAFDPSGILEPMIEMVTKITTFRTNGIARPTVLMVTNKDLPAADPIKIRYGQYTKADNTIRLNRLCELSSQPMKCETVLFHELIHWIQRASVSWPGTQTEWELEAQKWEQKYTDVLLGTATNTPNSGFEWVPPGLQPP